MYSLICGFCPLDQRFARGLVCSTSGFLQICSHLQHPCLRLYPSRYRADSGLAPVRNVRRQAHITNEDAGKTPASSFAVSDIFSKVCHHICQSDGFQFPLHRRLNPVQLVIENIMDILPYRTVRVRILVEMEQRIFLYTLPLRNIHPEM